MRYEIAVIGLKSFVAGLKAAGVGLAVECEASEAPAARKALSDLIERKDVGLVIVGESVAVHAMDLIEDVLQNRFLPAVVVLQDGVVESEESRKLVSKTIEKATGISFIAGE
ncbi:MAG: V-type ATP synthase subunit F [Candidatus Micrarchaeota archaeon]